MSVKLEMDINHPDLGKGHVRIEAEGIPHDLFVPMALSHLGKDDDRMAALFQQVLTSMSYEDDEDFDESEDESQ